MRNKGKTSIEKVPVKKNELLKKLEENKKKHESEWKQAWAGYQKAWIQNVTNQIGRAKTILAKAIEATEAEGLVRFPTEVFQHIEAQAPVNYAKDYDMAIDVINAFQTGERTANEGFIDDGIIVLSIDDFNRFWRDDWNWRKSHVVSMLSYGATGPEGADGPQGPTGPDGVHDLRI